MDNQYDSDNSDNSEVDIIITKKKKFMNSIIKLNSNISLSSIIPRITKKQHPTYKNIIKEINEKHYKKAETLCKEFLNFFPKSYSLRCLLAYIYRCLNNYEQAHLYLKEAINLNSKRPVAYFIRGEIFFWQNKYRAAIYDLENSLRYKAKINNFYIILGNSHLFNHNDALNYSFATKYYDIALKNDPNNYLCLKHSAYNYEKKKDYSNTLKVLDKLAELNKKDSLILCYYGEILCNMTQYSKAISYFTRANTIDPENIHNLNKRAITYYILQEYDKAVLDLDEIIQLDSLNSSAYYLKSLTYYTKNDINNALISFKKYTKLLNSVDSLTKIELFHLEYLLNKDSSIGLNNVLTKINQVINISKSESLLLIRCKIQIELQKYHEAKVDWDRLHKLIYHNKWVLYIYLLKEYSDFWSYLYENCKIGIYDFTELGIVNELSKYMYRGKKTFKFIFYIKVNNY
jgi:tetratricopeptide (TPR) repeat protein